MSQTDAQVRAARKYREKFEYLQVRVSSDYKDIVVHHVEKTGESLNTFICRAITETIERDNSK